MTDAARKTLLAEQLLHGLAAQLRSVPFDRRVHLRALELKREVRAWEASPPDPARADAVLDEIRALIAPDRESVPPPSEAA